MWRLLRAILRMIKAGAKGVLGLFAGPDAPAAPVEDLAEALPSVEDIKQAVEKVEYDLKLRAPEKIAADQVLEYVKTPRSQRMECDLSLLSTEQKKWLITSTENYLSKVATLERWVVRGMLDGTISMPACDIKPKPDSTIPPYLQERIARHYSAKKMRSFVPDIHDDFVKMITENQ